MTLIWSVGDTQPSFSMTITSGGEAVNLSSSTAVFKMRAVGSSTTKVNAAATVVSPKSEGNVRYDWQTADVDTAGTYLAWFEITTSGAVESVGEQLIEFRAHAPATAAYVELEQMKDTLSLAGKSWADRDIQDAIIAASRDVDNATGRVFTSGSTVNYYDASSCDLVFITDDATSISSIDIDTAGNGTYSTNWSSSYWIAGPYNNPGKGWPYEWVERRAFTSPVILKPWIPKCVRVTGTFGWTAVPAPIQEATKLLTHVYLRRKREAPFGIVTVGSESGHAMMRIAQVDPQVAHLLSPYVKTRPFA